VNEELLCDQLEVRVRPEILVNQYVGAFKDAENDRVIEFERTLVPDTIGCLQ
jgi:hypothetical protein